MNHDYHPDTIAAIATPPGRGGIGIVRVSGPAVEQIALALLGRMPNPRRAEFHSFADTDGGVIDQGIVLRFEAPASFTGEAVLELQGHGGAVVMDLLLARVLALGARLARPGEFTERAWLNDRIDLAQAEAIADLIDAGSAQAARAAMRSLSGEFSARVQDLLQALVQLRVYVEAAMDFPDEDIDFLADDALEQRLSGIEANFVALDTAVRQGRLLRDGMTVVIAGRPNAGKSSLLNALAGQDSAIVTHIPGTTRDLLREHIQLDGMPLHVIDTAGLHDSDDPVEQEGMRRTRTEIERADRVLLVIDDSDAGSRDDPQLFASLPPGLPCTRVYNKIDLSGKQPGVCDQQVYLCARSGEGVDLLRKHLEQEMGYAAQHEGEITARRRHLDALARARAAYDRGCEQLRSNAAGELLAEELRLAQQALGEITGEFTSDELLGEIFSSFCIGK